MRVHAFFFFALFLFVNSYTFCQIKGWATIVKHTGDSIRLKTTSSKTNYFLDDDDDFIRGVTNNSRHITISKTNIKAIILDNQSIFEVYKDDELLRVGHFSARGKITIFETYRITSSNTAPVFNGDTFGGGPSVEIVKDYFELIDGHLIPIDISDRLKQLSMICLSLKERLRVFKSLRDDMYAGDNINFYNQVCGNDKPFLSEPSELILFRKKGRQNDLSITIYVNGLEYTFPKNHFESVFIENAIDIKICAMDKTNCITKTFSPDRINFIEINSSKKDNEIKIEYVDNGYGALQVQYIKETMK